MGSWAAVASWRTEPERNEVEEKVVVGFEVKETGWGSSEEKHNTSSRRCRRRAERT